MRPAVQNQRGGDCVQGGIDPNNINGVGTSFGLLAHALPGPNKRLVLEPSIILN
jgi:hypothetical protein